MSDVVQRIQVRGQVLGCAKCGLRASCRAPVPFSGDNPSPIVVMGEAPGKEEDADGRPFVGPAGRFLRVALDGAMGKDGWNKECAYVNAVSCYPARTPTAEEVVACKDNLVSQLRLMEPWYVLALGGVAISAFWPKVRIGDMRGRWWVEDGLGGIVVGSETRRRVWFYATFHPSAVMRAGGSTSKIGKVFVEDLERWAAVISDGKRPPLNVDCVKCGRGDRKGMAEMWERNLGVCRKHAELAGIGFVSTAASRRGGGVRAQARHSAISRPGRGRSATPGTLFG